MLGSLSLVLYIFFVYSTSLNSFSFSFHNQNIVFLLNFLLKCVLFVPLSISLMSQPASSVLWCSCHLHRQFSVVVVVFMRAQEKNSEAPLANCKALSVLLAIIIVGVSLGKRVRILCKSILTSLTAT